MPTPAENEKKLEEMLAAFEKTHSKEGKNLRDLVGNTPELKQYMLEAIDKGNLDSINALDPKKSPGAVGTYDPTNKSIQLPLDYLKNSDKNPLDANMLRMTIGHELQHAINRDSIQASQDKLVGALETISKGPSPHDYTAALKDYNASARDREARDEMAGFNVLAAHVKRENPNATQQELYRKLYDSQPGEMSSYFDTKGKAPNQTYEPKPGITINDKLQVEPTKENVEAFGKHFYDARNYPANYLGQLITGIGNFEQQANAGNPKPPEVRVNLGELGLTQGTGANLGKGEVALPSNVVDATTPRLAPQQPNPEAAPPTPAKNGHDHDHHVEGHQHGNNRYIQEVIDRLNITAEDRQQFRNDGQQQLQQLESQKAQEAKPLQPTQESPVQETPARKMGSM